MTTYLWRIGFACLTIFTTFLLTAQTDELPVHFGQFFNNYQINPAQGGAAGEVEFLIGTRQNSGVFRGVHTSYASGLFRAGSKNDNFHVVGLHFNRDAEGEVLRRNRICASYSRHLKISNKNTLAIGVGLGTYQFVIRSNPVSGGASAGVFDSSAGLHLYSEKGYVGLALRQANGGEVRPLDQVITLQPRYDLMLRRELTISEHFRISPTAFLSYADVNTRKHGLNGGVGMLMLLSGLLHFGGTYENGEGAYAFLGLHDLDLGTSSKGSGYGRFLNVDFSYFLPESNNGRTNVNSFELTVRYFISQQ